MFIFFTPKKYSDPADLNCHFSGHRRQKKSHRKFAYRYVAILIAGWSLRTRFLRRSAARDGQSRNHSLQLGSMHRTRAAIRKSGAFEEALPKITRHSTPIPPAPGTSACARRTRETKGGGSRARQQARALPQAHDTRKLESKAAWVVGQVTPLELGFSSGDCSSGAPHGLTDPGAQRRDANGPRAPMPLDSEVPKHRGKREPW